MRCISLPPCISRPARPSKMIGGMVALLLFVLMGCAPRPLIRPEIPGARSLGDVEDRIRAEAEAWEKTPHVLGGAGKDGIDCSGFVALVNQKLFGIELPRTAEEQAGTGTPVPRKQLQAGDLVFFMPSSKKPHVGIYLSRGEFVHVSSSRGVMISNVHDPYWWDCYWTARRILQM
ncbi:MAG: hypothetical protein AUK29_10090 [Nitrospirae bacterium CG2_30_53_67]|nr:MAG: hypothetical protein AUK29_10090 [Nitrospirae bacterium CG2_30_53_67]